MVRMRRSHGERHRVGRAGWLRAAVLGANDGIISTASLILGIAASGANRSALLLAAVAGAVAGAMSMAAGEYVSVSSQADTEAADLRKERRELETSPAAELQELTAIYIARGVHADTARLAAEQMMAHDALSAHARDELHINEATRARPISAAIASATAFMAGAMIPLSIAAAAPNRLTLGFEAMGSALALAALGAIGAKLGDANPWKAIVRVVFWGAVAMAVTAGIGKAVGPAG